MRHALVFVAALAFVAGTCATTGPALAAGTSLHVCNNSAQSVNITVGYFTPGEDDTAGTLYGPFVSRGWWTIEPGACVSAANPFSARYMWWWGSSNDATYDGSANDTSRRYCIPDPQVKSSAFNFEDENESEEACTSGHYASDGSANWWVSTRKVDVDVDPDVSIE